MHGWLSVVHALLCRYESGELDCCKEHALGQQSQALVRTASESILPPGRYLDMAAQEPGAVSLFLGS